MLILYTRHGCHLCEDFEAELRRLESVWDFTFEVRDVDAREPWRQAYSDQVPILFAVTQAAENQEISRYFLDQEALRRYLGVG